MIFASAIVVTFLVSCASATKATKTIKNGAEYHIKSNSFGYDPEVGQVMFIGSTGEEDVERGLRRLQTDYYLKTTACDFRLTASQAQGVTYLYDYTLGK